MIKQIHWLNPIHCVVIRSVLLFSKLGKMGFGYFDLQNIFSDNVNICFWGDLANISITKEVLYQIQGFPAS